MILKYYPPQTILINKNKIVFGEARWSVRSKVNAAYEEKNVVFEMPGAGPIQSRRDTYREGDKEEAFFILSYDMGDLLREVEVHACERIEVLDVSFCFNDNLEVIAFALSNLSPITIQGDGEYFFKDLKLTISNKWKMGSVGDTLGYFYCGADVSHLENSNIIA